MLFTLQEDGGWVMFLTREVIDLITGVRQRDQKDKKEHFSCYAFINEYLTFLPTQMVPGKPFCFMCMLSTRKFAWKFLI